MVKSRRWKNGKIQHGTRINNNCTREKWVLHSSTIEKGMTRGRRYWFSATAITHYHPPSITTVMNSSKIWVVNYIAHRKIVNRSKVRSIGAELLFLPHSACHQKTAFRVKRTFFLRMLFTGNSPDIWLQWWRLHCAWRLLTMNLTQRAETIAVGYGSRKIFECLL